LAGGVRGLDFPPEGEEDWSTGVMEETLFFIALKSHIPERF
jgi:hypothetical protein